MIKLLQKVKHSCAECSINGKGCLSVHAKSLQSYPTLCNPMDCSKTASSVHEWAAVPFSSGSSQSRDRTPVSLDSGTAGRFFTDESAWKHSHYLLLPADHLER